MGRFVVRSGIWRRRFAVALRIALASTLAFLGLVVVPSSAASADTAAAGAISLDKTSSATVLLGGDVTYHLAATNPSDSGTEQYNLSYVDVLPAGVTYVSGSTSPADFGEPQVITITDDDTVTPALTHQVLIWSNVADLTPGSTRTLTFTAAVSADDYPVGSTVTNDATASASPDAREVPAFDSTGLLQNPEQVVTSADSATTKVAAVTVAKGEGSPESELLRGVNDNHTVYSLTVTNNEVDTTSDLVVTDYLPAGLEFLGCGGSFNSTDPEYPGASNTVDTVADCDTPVSVETVENPDGYPAGVYTKVTWEIGSLAAGASHTIHYAAGIPQRANTATWSGTEPTAASGKQTANLDNNNGASTRETGTEQTLTNSATVSGTFQGESVGDSTSHTVTAEDLRLVKSVSPTSFTQGQLATYTLDIDASEYVDLSGLSITDVIPNGMCPIDSDTNWTALAACAAQSGHGPTNATITGVVANADGTYTVTFTPDTTALTADGHLVITYQALMLPTYRDGQPTSANDDFTNHATISGTSTPRTDTNSPDSDPVTVYDDSSATIASSSPTLTKLRMSNASTMTCSDDPADYTVSKSSDSDDSFAEGDRVCFLLVVDFPRGIDTRNAQLTDFLPTNLTYESSKEISPGGLVSSIAPTTPTSYVIWDLGSGSPRTVARGTVLEIVVSAIVTSTSPLTSASDPTSLDTENLAKFRYTNSAGLSDSLRDWVGVTTDPAPAIGITKGVESIDSTDVDTGSTPHNVDGSTVHGGSEVTFRIDLQNLSTTGQVNAEPIASPDVWDVLPAGITCAAITNISNQGSCYDAGATGRPNLSSGDTTSSVIRWQLGASFTLDPEAFRTLTYTMLVPADTSVSAVYNNTAAVASFTTKTNIQTVATHNPAANISADVDATAEDVPAASDVSSVVVPDAKVAKTNVTDITESGNTVAQAVVGETLTYTIRLTIPAHTSVYNGSLLDVLPAGVDFVGPASALYSSTGTSPATAALPDGVSLDTATGALSFGATYANNTDSDQLFEVRIPALVNKVAANVHGKVQTNTATFTSDTAASGGTAITPRIATSSVTIVEPSPTLTKAASPTTVAGGSVVTYTLTAANASGRPAMHDSWVVDCLPGGLLFGSFTQTPNGTTATATAGTGSNGCAVGYTRIAWKITDLAGGSSLALKYTATVITTPSAGAVYTNVATLTGSTLADGKTDPTAADNPTERTYTRTASKAVTVAGASVNKTVDPSTLAPGQTGTYTVTVTLPANVAFYDSAVMDALPAQMTFGATTSITCTNADATDCSTGIPGTLLGPTSSVVGWVIGDLAPSSQQRTITIVYTATMNVSGNSAGNGRQNTAYYRWNVTDGSNPTAPSTSWGSNGASKAASVTVIEPSMSITKTVNGASSASAAPGDELTYQVTATNASSGNIAPAYNLTVTDVVPAGVIVSGSSLTASGGVLSGTNADGSGGTITWVIAGPLAKGDSVRFTYTGTLAASSALHTGDTETNTATVAHYESLPSGGKTTYSPVSTTATVTPQFPHITPTKSVSSGPAYLGKPKTWTITLTNDGGATAYHVGATDTLPMNWSYDAGSARVVVSGGVSTPVEPVMSQDAAGHQVLTWADLGTLTSTGANTIVITFSATPADPQAASDPGVGSTTLHTNSVSTTAQDATGATGNATGAYNGDPATASTSIDSADLQIIKASGDAVAGSNLTYTLDVKNNGPDVAVGPFTVTDALPSELGAISWSGTGWTCNLATTTLTCERTDSTDTLASGASFPAITIVAAVPSDTKDGVSLSNTATVGASTYDPKPDNNSSTVTTSVGRSADLGIVKHTSGTITAGTDATYTLDVTNHGPSDSVGPIVVTDALPDGTTFVSASGTGWDCADAGQVLTCTHADGLANGEAAGQITVTVQVAADATGKLTNSATVSGPETDPKPSNNTDSVTDPVNTSADLAIIKNHVGTFTSGDEGTYEFTVTNNGPSAAAKTVEVTDQLAAELTFVSDNSDDWSCTVDGDNLLTCKYSGSLAVGTSSTFKITVAIDAAVTDDVTNSATVSSPTADPNLGNNTDDDTTGVDVSADLGIKKTHIGDATAGKNIDFTLAVTNHGKSDLPGPITVTDTLPAGLSYVSASGANWDCSADGKVITCTRSNGLAAGASAPDITVRAHVAADAGPAVLTNVASVAGIAPDPNPSNNTDSDKVNVVDEANVSITKTADPTSVSAGSVVTWTLTIANDGPSDADNVQVSDALPAGLSYVGIDADSQVTCADANPIDCQVSSMPAGASYQITVRAKVGSGVPDGTKITNEASVSTSTPGDEVDDNTDSATITVHTSADLSLTKTHTGDSVVAGGQVSFQLAVHNAGPSDAAADVIVTDTLPVGMTYVSSAGSAWTCTAAPADASGQQVTCLLADGASVPAGTDAPPLSLTTQVDSAVNPDDLADGKLTNHAAVTSPTDDPHPANNDDSDAVPVTTSADLSIVKTHTGSARVGDPLEFTLEVANAGPSVARSVKVTDTLPRGLAFVSASGTGWTCDNDGQVVTCTLDATLSTGASAAPITVTATVLPAAYPGVTNTAKVGADTDDPTPDNNTSADPVTVPAKVDLAITKTHRPATLQVGGQATYTLAVDNLGETDDPGPITVADPLPAGLTFVSATGNGWECAASGQNLTCTRASGLAKGARSSITLVATVGAEAYPDVTNIATVGSPAEDVDPDNNTATDPATVQPLFDLVLTKKLATISTGSASWLISVTNNGPNEAPGGAVVTDDLPSELRYVRSSGDGWTCTASAQLVTCTYDRVLKAGATASFTLDTTVSSGVTGRVTNSAVVEGGNASTATGEIPSTQGNLAYTGGVALGAGLLGLGLLGVGLVLVMLRRRRT